MTLGPPTSLNPHSCLTRPQGVHTRATVGQPVWRHSPRHRANQAASEHSPAHKGALSGTAEAQGVGGGWGSKVSNADDRSPGEDPNQARSSLQTDITWIGDGAADRRSCSCPTKPQAPLLAPSLQRGGWAQDSECPNSSCPVPHMRNCSGTEGGVERARASSVPVPSARSAASPKLPVGGGHLHLPPQPLKTHTSASSSSTGAKG